VSVVVVGLNHRTAPLALLEQMAVDDAALPKALHDVVSREHVSEAVVLSTCNRTEVYVVAERFHGAFADLRNFLADLSYLPPEGFSDELYVHFDDEAATHLFSVASGLDSDVLGEVEILGQVRNAWQRAQEEHTSGPQLNMLFRHALEAGKRVRTDTDISRHSASVSGAAVDMVADRLPGGLRGARILVLGAGEVGTGMVKSLIGGGAADVLVANRTLAKAEALAESVGGRAIPMDEVPDALTGVDVLMTSTGATSMLVEHGTVQRVIAERDGRPLLIVDMAVPRDVDPTVAEVPGVELLDMDDLRAFAERGIDERRSEVDTATQLLLDQVERYLAQARAREVAPLVSSLWARAEDIRTAEVDRYTAKLGPLDERQRAAVEAVTKGIIAKLLHEPTVGVNGNAGTPKGERLADALRELFNL
jgi:glutamyl-tRNA reductase